MLALRRIIIPYSTLAFPVVIKFSPPKMQAMATSSDAIELEEEKEGEEEKKKRNIFVAGSTGRTGRRIVEKLLSRGFAVRAGATDLDRAGSSLPQSPDLQLVRADVTEGADKLAQAIGGADAVVCATGFRRSWDLFAPWKVDNLGTVNLVEACRKAGAEQYVRKSGINYTIIRPGGLRDEPAAGNIIMEPEDTLYEGSISRDQVADVAVEALECPESFYKVVEIVARADTPNRSIKDLFSSIKQK
ncbi:uncharacterized protein At2g34460, chloroplastic isoform X2 [Ananas comosus]|uniref:Uncharacterized protein At2g34460, chloroplastic isoform X2 n=1 Tax=Ananas comosus TaxID=4615 RepID=A0A6P5EWF0_ANACO|nr:uncharacterized protein At2g34460, chloroplastic isoform X2 [Ananas comosus]